ncbi:hypothetical protein GCM10027022_10850 [Alpinimonas psychrophila]
MVHEGANVEEVPALMAHLNLVMIHPFRDGNGRMARCLQSLILAAEGVLSPVFMSVEEYLGNNTQDYYRMLAEVCGGTGLNWNTFACAGGGTTLREPNCGR